MELLAALSSAATTRWQDQSSHIRRTEPKVELLTEGNRQSAVVNSIPPLRRKHVLT